MNDKLLPAIRGKIGEWRYYTSSLTFGDIANYVKKVDNELHESKTLSDLMQRSITKNYIKIKEYILSQDERFFNSLVLAVYDGDPEWIEVEVNYKEHEFFNMGLLKLNGEEKIFPIDGQHRVEGIKNALEEDPSLENETIPVIFIGHSKTKEGMERSRRLFTTLNRYAKPVSMRDIIALDEDDIIAIVTRKLIEDCELFKYDRIQDTTEKAISDQNSNAFTTIITLYDCNKELFKNYKINNNIKGSLTDYLKNRPSNEIVDEFNRYCFEFWNIFENKLDVVQDFIENGIRFYRNRDNGGNLLFRPTGLCMFVQSIMQISKLNNQSFEEIIDKFNDIELELNNPPWNSIFWDGIEKHIISGNDTLIKLMLIYLYDKSLLKKKELKKLEEKYETQDRDLTTI